MPADFPTPTSAPFSTTSFPTLPEHPFFYISPKLEGKPPMPCSTSFGAIGVERQGSFNGSSFHSNNNNKLESKLDASSLWKFPGESFKDKNGGWSDAVWPSSVGAKDVKTSSSPEGDIYYQMGRLSSVVEALTLRMSTLEQSCQEQYLEINGLKSQVDYLKGFAQPSYSASPVFSNKTPLYGKLHPQAKPFESLSEYSKGFLSPLPPPIDIYPAPHSSPSQSLVDYDSQASNSPIESKFSFHSTLSRRSTQEELETFNPTRWNVVPAPPVDSTNYRTLIENDNPIEPLAFIKRILANNDQQASLFLQQRLMKTKNEDTKRAIWEAVGDFLLELSLNKFGNFLVSRCLESGTAAVRESYIEKFQERFLELSCDQFACHVVQKVLDVGKSGTKELIISELIPHVSTLTLRHSGHVWTRILSTSNPKSFFSQLSTAAKGQWVSISQCETGSLIVQSILECWSKEEAQSSELIEECEEGLLDLCMSQWGNHIANHFIEHRGAKYQLKVLQNATMLAADAFGARSVERALRVPRGTTNVKALGMIAKLVDDLSKKRKDDDSTALAVDVSLTPSGANLIIALLTTTYTTGPQKIHLMQVLQAAPETYKSNAFYQRVVNMSSDIKLPKA